MNSIESNFVPYQIAVDMKSIGFDEPYFGFYLEDEPKKIYKFWYDDNWDIKAPLYRQAFRWFRDKYNLMIPIYKDDIGQYYFSIPNSDRLLDTTNYCSESYEEAELECLKKLIEIVKKK